MGILLAMQIETPNVVFRVKTGLKHHVWIKKVTTVAKLIDDNIQMILGQLKKAKNIYSSPFNWWKESSSA